MSLENQLNQDLISAMKAKDEVSLLVLRLIKTAITNYKIAKKSEQITEDEVVGLLQKQVKQRKESIESYQNAGRADLAVKEESELKVIEKYLPAQAGEAEIKALLQKIIQEKGFTTAQAQGLLMKEAMPALKGRADGKLVQKIAQELLR